MAVNNSFEQNGVLLSKKTIYSNDKVKVEYSGLLAKCGAEQIIMHVGYGDNWDESTYVLMQADEGMFSAEIEILEYPMMNLCFKDNADNWDNNSGQNYSFKISKKRASKPAAKKTTSEKVVKEKVTKKTGCSRKTSTKVDK